MEAQSLFFLVRAGSFESSDVVRASIHRSLGEVARADVDVMFPSYVDPDELLGRPAQITFGRTEAEHTQSGVVMGVTLVASPDDKDERRCVHRLHITSYMGLLD